MYVAVLFITLIVMATVAAGLSISTSSLRGETDRSSRLEALRVAESEIHRQAALMKTSSSWRSAATNNVFSGWQSINIDGVPIAGTQVRYRFFDSDGDLADDPTDPVELTVHAKIGRSQAAVGVRLESNPVPLDLLQYSVTVSHDLKFDKGSGGVLTCERPVQVGHHCQGNSSGVITTPRLECNGNVEVTLRGDLGQDSVTLPNQDVLSYYTALGTEIPRGSIPLISGDKSEPQHLLIEDRLISPTSNPFGNPDPAGIYWIDAAQQKVVISHCRLEATLVILRANGVEVREGISWSYPNSADVILAADSDITLKHLDKSLDEADRGVNFNPPSSPYRQTVSNNTANDVYPPELRGIIYSTEDVELIHTHDYWAHLTGLIVCKDLRIEYAWMTITHLDELLSNPPAPFADPTPMRFVRGSFRRVPLP